MSPQNPKMAKIVLCVLFLALVNVSIGQDEGVITSAPESTSASASAETSAPSTSTTAKPAAAPESPVSDVVQSRNLEPEPVQCKYENVTLRSGDKHAFIGECIQLTCHPDGMITGITCPFTIAPPECQVIPQDLSKPYPQCCETWTC